MGGIFLANLPLYRRKCGGTPLNKVNFLFKSFKKDRKSKIKFHPLWPGFLAEITAKKKLGSI